MRAGVLRHRVTIEEQTTTTDAYGQPLESWSPMVSNLAAEIRDVRGREFWSSGQAPAGEVTTRVRIRWRNDVARQMRVAHNGEVFEIDAIIDPDGRRTELHLMCKEMS